MKAASARPAVRYTPSSQAPYYRQGRLGSVGLMFTVWQPNAQRVAVVGPFNGWDGRRHRMTEANGIWSLYIPGLESGAECKFEVTLSDEEAYLTSASPCEMPISPVLGGVDRGLVL